MTPDDVRRIAREVAREEIRQALSTLAEKVVAFMPVSSQITWFQGELRKAISEAARGG